MGEHAGNHEVRGSGLTTSRRVLIPDAEGDSDLDAVPVPGTTDLAGCGHDP